MPNVLEKKKEGKTAATNTAAWTRESVLQDLRMGWRSRHASLLGRKEVLTGKAKFGIFGDGKELPQLALARFYQPGDIRSGYYRDQTLMMAIGQLTVQQFFAQLYAHTSVEAEPHSAGRQMNGHFATRMLNEDGSWKDLTAEPHSSADCSPTASQMPRLVGLAYASKLYRNLPELKAFTNFSKNGNEIAWGTIGDASTSEGIFWESINAAGVLQVPMVMNVWDDNYGISVHISHQTTKASISNALSGFKPEKDIPGIEIIKVKAWDYPALLAAYQQASELARTRHQPVLVHVYEVTQPQGHSTSGSHERYKGPERLAWETEYDCLAKFGSWIVAQGLASAEEIAAIEAEEKKHVQQAKNAAWTAYWASIKQDVKDVAALLGSLAEAHTAQAEEILAAKTELEKIAEPFRKDAMVALRKGLVAIAGQTSSARQQLLDWKAAQASQNEDRFNSQLYSESAASPLRETGIPAEYAADAAQVDGRQVLQATWDSVLRRYPNAIAFGEDVGFLGDVNQAFSGMQEKYGALRVSDTGIREATILGQAIGMAMRGLRPIAEIQYLDYLLYALQIMSDDLASLRYRTKGGQMAPVIVRTRGHRLEGIWHSGSPMGTIISALRGMHILVPRNMTQAAGFYNTLLKGDDPALVVEVLNGYRLKEPMPSNIDDFCLPLGVPEVLRQGTDITIVTYGANCRIALEAADLAQRLGIFLEVIDVQSLVPFDRSGAIAESLKRTSRVIFFDEDVPGGASAYMMQQVLEEQGAYRWLDSPPRTLTAKAHRPAYATDGDYFSKPSVEDLLQLVTEMMHEADPARYSLLY